MKERWQQWAYWAGWLVSCAPVYVVLSSARWKLTENPWYVQEIGRIGWQTAALPLLAYLQLTGIVLFLIPPTAVLGAVILTGYLGGAIASYVRIGEYYPPLVPFTTAVLAWLGIFLREPRLWVLLPFRRKGTPMMTTRYLRSLLLLAGVPLAAATLAAQSAAPAPSMRGDGPAPASKPFSITRSDPGLDAVVAADAKAELLARGFGLNEGPVWMREGQSGYLLLGGLLDNVIYKIAADKTVSVFLERAGYTGTDVNHTGTQTRSGRSHVLLIGPSCASLDSQGRLIWCADNDRAVMRLEKDGTTRTKLSGGSDDGKRFSGPNDIVVAKDDAVYLTDNDFGLRDGGQNPDKQLANGIWRIKDGKSTMVLEATVLGGIPNGIALSPDERYLYANAGQRMFRYEVRPDGSLGPGTPFTQGPGIGDGMKVDTLGNVYSTSGAGPGIVRITSPSGTLLGYLNLEIVGGEPKRQICATNVAFGDPDGKGLYVTACDAVYRIRMKVAGVMAGPKS